LVASSLRYNSTAVILFDAATTESNMCFKSLHQRI
jgi:hypothetical protein